MFWMGKGDLIIYMSRLQWNRSVIFMEIPVVIKPERLELCFLNGGVSASEHK